MLGYNVSVPPYVRQGLLLRSFHNYDLLPKIHKPVLITHGAADAIVNPPPSIGTRQRCLTPKLN
jgi:non-heme chloroperoxidase